MDQHVSYMLQVQETGLFTKFTVSGNSSIIQFTVDKITLNVAPETAEHLINYLIKMVGDIDPEYLTSEAATKRLRSLSNGK